MIFEAKCLSCDTTFNPIPTSEQTLENPTGLTLGDMEHLVRDDGTECGGYGLLQGSWEHPSPPLTNPVTGKYWGDPPDWDPEAPGRDMIEVGDMRD